MCELPELFCCCTTQEGEQLRLYRGDLDPLDPQDPLALAPLAQDALAPLSADQLAQDPLALAPQSADQLDFLDLSAEQVANLTPSPPDQLALALREAGVQEVVDLQGMEFKVEEPVVLGEEGEQKDEIMELLDRFEKGKVKLMDGHFVDENGSTKIEKAKGQKKRGRKEDSAETKENDYVAAQRMQCSEDLALKFLKTEVTDTRALKALKFNYVSDQKNMMLSATNRTKVDSFMAEKERRKERKVKVEKE